MATLILSTVGTALGGPVGSAIGALIGQSIDQQLLAPARRGPRLGDLSVQTSSYGTQIPRVYGTMRVAGSVVWSTDLIEHSQSAGAKGQPDVTYSYTVSFAVALSSRRAISIGRIWADGRLLRGAAGDFKVPVTFRFYEGGEDQIIDPLIGSAEGIASTPAYRGVSLAVFEDLQLRDFGNRIPFLTFEVIADDEAPTAGSVLVDASGGALLSDAAQSLTGFAAYGASIRSAIEPLADCFGIQLFDDGKALRQASSVLPQLLAEDEFSNSADKTVRLQREQLAVRSLPAILRLSYYDAARDYQTGETRATASEQRGNEVREELPAVLSAGDAKSLAQQMLARAWARREKLTLRLPPKRLALEPGSTLSLPLQPSEWVVETTTIEGFVVVAELAPSATQAQTMFADPGRIVSNSDVIAGPLSLGLFDVPNVVGAPPSQPTLLLAATQPTHGWKRRSVEISWGGTIMPIDTAAAKSMLGQAVGVLSPAATDLIDQESSVDVFLIDADQWLTSCDDDALAAGENLAVLGSELIQFGQVMPLGGGGFRLSRLLRGRGGTEWACSDHVAGEAFCLVSSSSLRPVALPAPSIGGVVTVAAAGSTVSVDFRAEGLRPPSPVNLLSVIEGDGSMMLSWTRRSRLGFAWLDEIDAPLGETSEQYRILLTGTAASIEISAEQAGATVAAADVAALGSGPASIEVRQIGDYAASRPAQLTINLV